MLHSGLRILTSVPTHFRTPHRAAAKHLLCTSMNLESPCTASPWQPTQLSIRHSSLMSTVCVTLLERCTDAANCRFVGLSRTRTVCIHERCDPIVPVTRMSTSDSSSPT